MQHECLKLCLKIIVFGRKRSPTSALPPYVDRRSVHIGSSWIILSNVLSALNLSVLLSFVKPAFFLQSSRPVQIFSSCFP